MDVPIKAVFLPQDLQGTDHLLGSVVGIAQHTGGKKKPLNIIPSIKSDGQFRQLTGRKGSTTGIVGAPIDAIFAVINAAVGHQYLQQRDAASVGGKAVTAACNRRGSVADLPGLKLTLDPAGCTGGVVFGGIRQNGQLFQKIHDSGSITAALTAARPFQSVDQVHQIYGNGHRSQNYNYIPNSRHNRNLQ